MLSFLYSAFMNQRRKFYSKAIIKSYKLDIPCISVGNLSMGGTGKTPIVIWLCQFFESHQKRGLVLTRGYKSQYEKSRAVLSQTGESFRASVYGDEPTMIINNLENTDVMIGRDRYENYLSHDQKYDFCVLDDGFQHLKIQRDLDLVLIDMSLDPKNFKVFPAGELREDVNSVSDDDLVVFTKGKFNKYQFEKIYLSKLKRKKSDCVYIDFSIVEFKTKNKIKKDLLNKRIVLVSGIAKGHLFKKDLERLGYKIVKFFNYSDHHQFTTEEVKELKEYEADQGLAFLCTEKDYDKLYEVFPSEKLFYARIEMEIIHGEKLLKDKLSTFL